MKNITKHIFIFILLMSMFEAYGQNKKDMTVFSYEFRQDESKKDSLPTLYCKVRLASIAQYKTLTLYMDDQERSYAVKDLKRGEHRNYEKQREFIYIKVDDALETPIVVMKGTDNQGNVENILTVDQRGNIYDPEIRKTEWKRHKARVDSLDYLGKHHWYKGADGKPRVYKAEKDSVYLIDRDRLSADPLQAKPKNQITKSQQVL